MSHKLRVARSLSLDDWAILAQAWLLLLIVDVALRRLPMPRIQHLLALDSNIESGRGDATATIERLHSRVQMAARHHLYTMSCLRTALVLQTLLCRRGIETVLRIGVRKNGDALAAHAWLEYRDRPICQPGDVTSRFAPLVPVRPPQ